MTTITKTTHAPYRFETVGSFLRPEVLVEARARFRQGEITKEELTIVEDKAIIDLIKKQEEVGLKSISDGEFRRSWWHLDFFWGLNGIEKTVPNKEASSTEKETPVAAATLAGKLSGENHPFIDHFKFVKAHISNESEVKQTIPAPAQLILELISTRNIESVKKHYGTIEALIEGVAGAYNQVLREFYDAGARVIQLDDCSWISIIDDDHVFLDDQELDDAKLEEIKDYFVTANNKAIEGLPEDFVINTHVCRGNFQSIWFGSGGYDNIASPLFDEENVDAYFLEYDSDRAGGFGPLAKVTDGKKVVLGLVTTKTGELENRDSIIARIKEAAQYVPLENLSLSPQCGFASTEEGNKLTEEQQWDKLRFIKSIADEVWREE